MPYVISGVPDPLKLTVKEANLDRKMLARVVQ
jgi:hypothetical protein